MQRDSKGRFTSTEQKRNTTSTPIAADMLRDLRDLARLEAAEAYLTELSVDTWDKIDLDEIKMTFVSAREEILKPYLQAPESELFQ